MADSDLPDGFVLDQPKALPQAAPDALPDGFVLDKPKQAAAFPPTPPTSSTIEPSHAGPLPANLPKGENPNRPLFGQSDTWLTEHPGVALAVGAAPVAAVTAPAWGSAGITAGGKLLGKDWPFIAKLLAGEEIVRHLPWSGSAK
jgi:hypothetical protein